MGMEEVRQIVSLIAESILHPEDEEFRQKVSSEGTDFGRRFSINNPTF